MSRPNSPAILAEVERIETIIAEHGPCTAHYLVGAMRMSIGMIYTRMNLLIDAGRAHIACRKMDQERNVYCASYALGPDPKRVKRQKLVAQPCLVHAAFFGRMA